MERRRAIEKNSGFVWRAPYSHITSEYFSLLPTHSCHYYSSLPCPLNYHQKISPQLIRAPIDFNHRCISRTNGNNTPHRLAIHPNRPAASISRDVQVLVGIIDPHVVPRAAQQSAVFAVERVRARVAAVYVDRVRQAGGEGGPAPVATAARAVEGPAGPVHIVGLDGDGRPVRVAPVLAEEDAEEAAVDVADAVVPGAALGELGGGGAGDVGVDVGEATEVVVGNGSGDGDGEEGGECRYDGGGTHGGFILLGRGGGIPSVLAVALV